MPKEITPIATIETDFATKFGIPRQSGIVNSLAARIIFAPEFCSADAVRGLEDFSHLWLIWGFSQANTNGKFMPTVRPPRLGGNTRMGVFATRSPFRPNGLGLSSVTLERIEHHTTHGPVLHVLGADLMHGTPIYDIKPYIAYTDSHAQAVGGFADSVRDYALTVDIEPALLSVVPPAKQKALLGILAHDPRPQYQADPNRVYGFVFAGLEVQFTVAATTLHVCSIAPAK